MPATQAEVGNLYDLLLQTRDGSTLSCRNKDGKLVNVSQVAYCTSIDRNAQGQHEETELQHKDQLIQLGSSNLIDREFDQWPQVSQGDWSGGMLQRVLTGSTPLTSFGPQSDPTRYWDGLGLLWPIDDYLPQQPVPATPDQAAAGGVMKDPALIGAPAGVVNIGANSPYAFAYLYQQASAPNNNILVVQGDGVQRTLTNPPDAAAGTFPFADMIFTQSALLWLSQGGGATHLNQISGNPLVATLLMTINNTVSVNFFPGNFAAGQVGNKPYLAFTWVSNANVNSLRVFDLSSGGYAAFVDAPFGVANTTAPGPFPRQVEFLGEGVVVVLSNYHEQVISRYDIPSATWSTLARFPASGVFPSNVAVCAVAGNLFVLVMQAAPALSGMPNSVDAYLIQGNSVQHIGPIVIQRTGDLPRGQYIVGMTQPTAYGPYAMFGIYYAHVSDNSRRVAIFAYDVLRGRIFKMSDIGPYDPDLTSSVPRRMGLIPPISGHPFGGSTLPALWGLAVPVLGASGGSRDITNVQRLLMDVSSPSSAFGSQLRQGVQIISSLIDFTSAQPKLFRQAVMTWLNPGLPSDTAITVRLDVWLDQDPANLNAVPDFTTGVVATGVNSGVLGQTTLKLLINKIAEKLVYRATTTGPSTTPTAAVKLVSVVIQAATGWVQTLKLDLAPNVQTNSKNGIVWDKQSTPGSPATDHVVAYNFLRQLWRLKGGEVTATFPNGDTGDWLIQDLHFDSPKPFAASFRADQQTTYQSIATVKLREDI